MSDVSSHWHVSKSIPVTVLFALALNIVGGIWGFSQMAASVQNNTQRIEEYRSQMERRIERSELQIENIRVDSQLQAVQLGRIETALDNIGVSLKNVERKLESSQGSSR